MYRFLPSPRQLMLAAAALLASAGPVHASGYVNNGDGWLVMPPQAKAAYIQGLNDTINFVYVNDDLDTAIVKVARTRCLIETKTTPVILSDMITTAYTKNPGLKVQPPIVVYVSRMADICKSIINQERTRMGLPAF